MSFLQNFLEQEGTIGAAYLISKAVDSSTKWEEFRQKIELDSANLLLEKVTSIVNDHFTGEIVPRVLPKL